MGSYTLFLMFSLISRSSLSSLNTGYSSLRFESVSLLPILACCNSEIFMTSHYPSTTSNLLYTGNSGELLGCFFLGVLVGFIWILILFLHCNGKVKWILTKYETLFDFLFTLFMSGYKWDKRDLEKSSFKAN